MNYTIDELNDYNKCTGKINRVAQSNLFITDFWGVNDLNQLKQFNIKCIINLCPGIIETEHPGITYFHLNVSDDLSQNILQYFDKIFLKLDELYSGKQNVIINCRAGISRSAAFVIGYLIKNGLSYENSFRLLKSYRPIISPNEGFIKQLKYYENICKNKVMYRTEIKKI